MIVEHIIEDMESVFKSNPDAQAYEVAFASYSDDSFSNIDFKIVEAFDWDDDEEFFLVPSGAAKHFKLNPRNYTAQTFLSDLKLVDANIADFPAYARARIKVAKDGSIASLNSPLWGTGYHDDEKILYFYHGKQPPETT